jgi:hypothetical protein
VKVASLPLLGSGKTDYVTLKRMTSKPKDLEDGGDTRSRE